MKLLITVPVKRCLFRGKVKGSFIKQTQTRKFTGITELSKLFDNKNNLNVYFNYRYFSNLKNKMKLMDFDVWLMPKFLEIKSVFNYFQLKAIDTDFRLGEFCHNSSVALQLVCNFLSQLRFTDLEDLVTPYCKQELQKNLMNWSKEWMPLLAIELQMIFNVMPCEIVIHQNEKEDGKSWVEITVIYYIWLKHVPQLNFDDNEKLELSVFKNNQENFYTLGVFNSKYMRELLVGKSDWTLSAVNFLLYDNVRLKKDLYQ